MTSAESKKDYLNRIMDEIVCSQPTLLERDAGKSES